MNILFCVQFYYPSVGGAQEVVRQVAERMVARGHSVCVATSHIPTRKSTSHNGVTLIEFFVTGNRVQGMRGEIERYQNFLEKSEFDIILFYAGQQWTFDAAWPVMSSINGRKVFVPCGYSGLFTPFYQGYFKEIPSILQKMDAIVYHAEDYRDINFAKTLKITNHALIPNGADYSEFAVTRNPDFRPSLSIDNSAFIMLTVGTITGIKGHMELLKAYANIDIGDRKSVLILNGGKPEIGGQNLSINTFLAMLFGKAGIIFTLTLLLRKCLSFWRVHFGYLASIQKLADNINRRQFENKRVIVTDFTRDQLIQAYLNADLFVFASNIEYSPLVLFEACAAGLPFLTVPVGNAEEITDWTKGGELCPAPVDSHGYTRVSPTTLAHRIQEMASDTGKLARLGQNGLAACRQRYNWDTIAGEYEDLFIRLIHIRPSKQKIN